MNGSADRPEYPAWPCYSEEEAAAVREVLLSGKVNYWGGQRGREFERAFAAATDSRYAVAVANGTVALDLALHALEIGPGDEVIVTPRTFLASGSCIVNAGAIPVFADVDPDSQNITPETAAPRITPRTRAIVCVHLNGWPCDMHGFRTLADRQGLALIEDCAQAHGARIGDRSVGSFGEIAAFSFCQDKIMTTGGEGGMVVTSDEHLWRRAWSYKDHGKSWDAVYNREHAPGFRWLHESFGTNWRLTEMQSAIGLIQLERLPEWNAARTRNARILHEAFTGLSGIEVPWPEPRLHHGWYKCYARVEPELLPGGLDRDALIRALNARGVPCMAGICPEIYRERCFVDAGLAPARRLPVARELGETTLMFPVHPALRIEHMETMAEQVRDLFRDAG